MKIAIKLLKPRSDFFYIGDQIPRYPEVTLDAEHPMWTRTRLPQSMTDSHTHNTLDTHTERSSTHPIRGTQE